MPDPVSRNILKTLVVFRILYVDFFLEKFEDCATFEIEERLFQKNNRPLIWSDHSLNDHSLIWNDQSVLLIPLPVPVAVGPLPVVLPDSGA